jgi:phosphoglycerate dehydrogenase-like enzyme
MADLAVLRLSPAYIEATELSMKALFLGGVAADTAAGIGARLPASLRVEVLDDPIDRARLAAAAGDADILVSNHWRADYPPAPKLRLVQSVATGIELFDFAALPQGLTVCNAFGHETAIAEYVLMTMLALHHRLFEIAGEFRERASWRPSWVAGGAPHGEIRGSTLGIVGYGRVGREVAKRAAAFGCRVLAANRSPRPAGGPVERLYPLAELDRMLPECDTVVLCTALGAETMGLIDARRLGLMRVTAFLINIARGAVADEAALFAVLRDGRIAGAALDVWWQYPTPAEPLRRGSQFPFHELANVILTPHNSGWTAGMVRRRWDEIADNLHRFTRGAPLANIVTI